MLQRIIGRSKSALREPKQKAGQRRAMRDRRAAPAAALRCELSCLFLIFFGRISSTPLSQSRRKNPLQMSIGAWARIGPGEISCGARLLDCADRLCSQRWPAPS
jgi:hypothetical protein